jgi:alpha-D-ribose 1-methylphosphonate 5-triphosphate diphosphatase
VAAGTIMLMAHDPATDDDVAEAVSWGSHIAEFPTTVRAAELAHAAGLRTVCGAPNVLRGQSHSGNVSATDLIRAGLCDGLASDYLPTTLLGAVAALVDRGVCDLPTAVAQVTSGPADTVGLHDRGRLALGQRGDLVLVTFDGALPTVRAVLCVPQRELDTVGSPS